MTRPDPRLDIDNAALEHAVMSKVETFARSFVRKVAAEARTQAPARTGKLRRSIKTEPVRRTGPMSVETGVTVLASYAAPVHEGARPHVIRPRTARVLRFEVEGGRIVFARRVNHPGNRPNPFLRRAVEAVTAADSRITTTGL